MAQNLAAKYSDKVAERFNTKALTRAAVNQDYDWSGVATVSVYSVDTVAMGNYTRSGTARYGTVTELGTTKQDLTLARDRSFTFSIDRGNWGESMMVTEAGKALARQLDEVVIPEIDIYRLAAWATAATANSNNVNTGVTDATNAYTNFLAAQERASDNQVPLTGRIAFMTAAYYNFLKQGNFVLDSEDFAKSRHSGSLGTVDGASIVVVPSSYFPASTDLIITHPSATVSPTKLEDYKTHDNPPGINGWLVEGRLIYDAFVLTAKADAIVAHRTAV